jgi:hypothetical protein
VRIGLDIDGVIYEWDRTARYMLREVLPNSPYKYRPPGTIGLHFESSSWDFIQERVSKEHWNWLWTEGVRLGLFRYGHLYTGSIQAIRELATIGDVVLITHRPKQAVTDTLAWLGYLDLPLAGVHLLTNQENKGDVTPCDIYLDDKPENCEDLLRATDGTVCLMDRPWNQHRPIVSVMAARGVKSYRKDSYRVHSWEEFITKVRAL